MYRVVKDFRIIDYQGRDIVFLIGSEINYNRKDDEITIYYTDMYNFTCTNTKDFDIEEYLEPINISIENNINENNISNFVEIKTVKHLQVLQFDNLLVMNKELEKINEDNIVSIRPVTITNMNNENTIYYIVVVRR